LSGQNPVHVNTSNHDLCQSQLQAIKKYFG
jgi:hypothetical protein